MTPRIKICGLSTAATMEAALIAGAEMVGLVFFAPSPRHIELDQAAALAAQARGRAEIVALSVNADDGYLADIDRVVAPDWLQLHGHETADRLAALKDRFGRRLIKAIKVSDASDIATASAYIDVADMLLYDAKAPQGARLPGGNGVAFDWTLLAAASRDLPMMLSGGLDADNVADAIAIARPDVVDVSSGVESAPGRKDVEQIRRFVAAVRGEDQADSRALQQGRSRV